MSIEAELALARSEIESHRTWLKITMDNARKVAVRAYESGYSERRLAAALGVDRMTIRTWLGKPTGREKLC